MHPVTLNSVKMILCNKYGDFNEFTTWITILLCVILKIHGKWNCSKFKTYFSTFKWIISKSPDVFNFNENVLSVSNKYINKKNKFFIRNDTIFNVQHLQKGFSLDVLFSKGKKIIRIQLSRYTFNFAAKWVDVCFASISIQISNALKIEKHCRPQIPYHISVVCRTY